MISASWPVPVAHSARIITPPAGFNRDRASDSASSESTSTVCRQCIGVDRTRLGHLERPAAGIIVVDAQPQHGVSIQQGLQHDHDVGLGDPRRGLYHHRLVELVDRAIHGV